MAPPERPFFSFGSVDAEVVAACSPADEVNEVESTVVKVEVDDSMAVSPSTTVDRAHFGCFCPSKVKSTLKFLPAGVESHL
jgi:hypothetical protein